MSCNTAVRCRGHPSTYTFFESHNVSYPNSDTKTKPLRGGGPTLNGNNHGKWPLPWSSTGMDNSNDCRCGWFCLLTAGKVSQFRICCVIGEVFRAKGSSSAITINWGSNICGRVVGIFEWILQNMLLASFILTNRINVMFLTGGQENVMQNKHCTKILKEHQ